MGPAGRQHQRISYQVIDEDTGKEVISVEVRRGLMKPAQCVEDEGVLLPVVEGIINKAHKETAEN